MPRQNNKHSFSFVKEIIEKAGYQLLDNEYKNRSTKLNLICTNGHHCQMSLNNFSYGKRCIECCGKRKFTLDEIKDKVASFGYEFLDEDYINARTKFSCKCPNGHIFNITWSNFNKGHRCAECVKLKRYSFEEAREIFSSRGYTLLDEVYTKATDKLNALCSKGHKIYMSLHVFKEGHGCGICNRIRLSDEDKVQRNLARKISKQIAFHITKYDEHKPFKSRTEFSKQVAIQIVENLGKPNGLSLDHIIPQSYFNFSNIDEVKACWDVNNLRYIPFSENSKRNNKMTLDEIKNLTERQRIILECASRTPKKILDLINQQG